MIVAKFQATNDLSGLLRLVRAIIWALMPRVVSEQSLNPALSRLIPKLSKNTIDVAGLGEFEDLFEVFLRMRVAPEMI